VRSTTFLFITWCNSVIQLLGVLRVQSRVQGHDRGLADTVPRRRAPYRSPRPQAPLPEGAPSQGRAVPRPAPRGPAPRPSRVPCLWHGAPAAPYLSYGPPRTHYSGGYQDRLLGGPLGLLDLHCTTPAGVKHKDYGGEVLG
jgi:hypothetical protein